MVARDATKRLSLSLLATWLAGCGPIAAMTSVATTAVAGTVYVRTQTVERTFAAPMPEVKEACRQALKEMAFTIRREESSESEYHILAKAASEYEIEVTLTPITPKATKVSVNADSLPERDKATGIEIINQMAALLSPPPPLHASPAIDIGRTTATGPMASTTSVVSATDTRPVPAVAKAEPSRVGDTWRPVSPQARNAAGAAGGEGGSMRHRYETAILEYNRGDFRAAIAHLRSYLLAQPDSAQRPRALYWLGESLYSQREYADALLQFTTIVRDYPQSPEAPRALLRGALACRQLHEPRQATALLETLIRQHPKSREAHLARTLMREW
jgi:tol-pal system protein YbgF